MKISFCVFSYLFITTFSAFGEFPGLYTDLKWKGRVCEFLAILKGDTDANKMPMGDAKLRIVN